MTTAASFTDPFESDLNFHSQLEQLRRLACIRHCPSSLPIYVAFRCGDKSPEERVAFARRAVETGQGIVDLLPLILGRREPRWMFQTQELSLSPQLDWMDDVEKVFVASHAGLEEEWEQGLDQRVVDDLFDRAIDATPFQIDTQLIWSRRVDVMRRLAQSISDFQELTQFHARAVREFEATPLLTRPFVPTRITMTCELRVSVAQTQQTLAMWFETCRATRHVPFLSLAGVPWQKVFVHLAPVPPDWSATASEQTNQTIFAMVDEWPDHVPWGQEKGRFVKSLLALTQGKPAVTIFHNPTHQSASLVSAFHRWEIALGATAAFDQTTLMEQGVVGHFHFDSVPFHPVVVLDVLTTNPHLVDTFVAVDDTLFRPAHLMKTVEATDRETRMTLKFSASPLGGCIVRVTKCPSQQAAKDMGHRWLFQTMRLVQDRHADLLTLYGLAQPRHLALPQMVPDVGSLWSLRQQAPDMFFAKFTRHCYAIPTIVNDDQEAERIAAIPAQIMVFPKTGPRQMRFTCHYNSESRVTKKQKFIYPGLTRNTLENADVWPLVPCCFTNDQMTGKKASLYKAYMADVENTTPRRRKLVKRAVEPSTSLAIFSRDIFGALTDTIDNFLRLSDDSGTWCRMGWEVGGLLPMLSHLTGRPIATPDASDFVVCWQQAPHLTLLELERGWKEASASTYRRLLERMFDVRLFVFSNHESSAGKQTGQGPGALSAHPFAQDWLLEPDDRVLMLFEHWGDAHQKLDRPHTEVIVSASVDRRHLKWLFSGNDPVSQALQTCLDQMHRQFVRTDQRLTFVPRCVSRSCVPRGATSQCLDQRFACRAVFCGDRRVTFEDTLPPLALPLSTHRNQDTILESVLTQQRAERAVLDQLAAGHRVPQVDPKLAFTFLWLLTRKKDAVRQRIWHTPSSPWEVEPHAHTRLVFSDMTLKSRQPFMYDGLTSELTPPYIVGPNFLILQHLETPPRKTYRLAEAKRLPPGVPFVLADQAMWARAVRLFGP